MKYYRLIETDHENEYIQSHLFIKEPETEEEKSKFEALKNLLPALEEIDYEEEFEDDFGDLMDEDGASSHFELAKDNGKLALFEEEYVKVLLKDNHYLECSIRVVTLSESIFNYDEEDRVEALEAFVSRSIFESCENTI